MTTLEILAQVELGKISHVEALELMEALIPAAKYKCGSYTGTFVKAEGNIAYFDISSPHDLIYNDNGLIGFRLEFAKTFKKI